MAVLLAGAELHTFIHRREAEPLDAQPASSRVGPHCRGRKLLERLRSADIAGELVSLLSAESVVEEGDHDVR